jgi:hypothetical protein
LGFPQTRLHPQGGFDELFVVGEPGYDSNMLSNDVQEAFAAINAGLDTYHHPERFLRDRERP